MDPPAWPCGTPPLAEGDFATGMPEEFAVFLKIEITHWAQVVERAGITAE